MHNNLFKQVIICTLIIAIVGLGALSLRNYLFPNEQKDDDSSDNGTYFYNEFQVVNVTTEVLIQRYFIDFKDKLITNPEKAYQLLLTDTKDQFESYSNFLEFVNNHLDMISSSYIKEYTIQSNGRNDRYIIVDQYGNQYTFDIKAVLVYEVSINYSSNL